MPRTNGLQKRRHRNCPSESKFFELVRTIVKIACISLGLKSSAPFSTVRLFPTKIQKIRQSLSIILIQDNQCGDDAWHPAAEREQKHDEHRPAAVVDHRQWREYDG